MSLNVKLTLKLRRIRFNSVSQGIHCTGGDKMELNWMNGLMYGLEVMDNEHKEMIENANFLYEAIVHHAADEDIISITTFLEDYVLTHFRSEEEMLLEYKYPDYEHHRKLHEDFKYKVHEIIDRINEEGITTKKKLYLNELIIDWLRDHIGKEDKKVAIFIIKANPLN